MAITKNPNVYDEIYSRGKLKDEETLYIKRGNNFIAVSEYSYEVSNAFPYGAHLVVAKNGSRMVRYNVDPAFAPLIAAITFAEDKMVDALHEAAAAKPVQELNMLQRAAWIDFLETVKYTDATSRVSYASAADIVKVGLNAMQEEAAKMLENPTVKLAYDKFLMVWELAKESNNNQEV